MAMRAATDNEAKFFEGWKTYHANNPVEKEREEGAGDDSKTERIMKLMEDDDD